jgi:hypothetical protein
MQRQGHWELGDSNSIPKQISHLILTEIESTLQL